LSLEQLNELWVKDEVIGGNALNRKLFMRHKDAILNMFGIIIECDLEHGYKYFISNPEVINDDTIEGWMLSTLTVNTILSDSASLRNRILLESVPAGEEYLQTIILALKTNRRLTITYQRFGYESYEKTVSPYALKLFHQRWYILTYTGRHMATYALDRMLSVEISDETFEMPEDFSPEGYFAEYYGITTDDTPMAHVVIRAYGHVPNYLRTLPLHASQKEMERTDEYTDFSYDIRPSVDFVLALISYSDGIEVLEPIELRQKIHDNFQASLERYSKH
jgi:hypothetical protein